MYWNLKLFEFTKYYFYFKSACDSRAKGPYYNSFVIKFFYMFIIHMDKIDKVQFGLQDERA